MGDYTITDVFKVKDNPENFMKVAFGEVKEKTISVEILKENGYLEYKDNSGDFGKRFFQKKFTDKKGEKYFINCYYCFYANNGEQQRFWDFNMQIETNNGAVEIQTVQWFNQDGIYSKRTIKEVEKYFEKMWIANGSPYYKLNLKEAPSIPPNPEGIGYP
jgi:hypothetical protein